MEKVIKNGIEIKKKGWWEERYVKERNESNGMRN